MTLIGHKDRTDAIVEQINRRHSETRKVIVREEKLPVGFEERLAEIEEKCLAFASFGSAFDALFRRVKALEARPVAAANDSVAVPAAFGEQVHKLDDLEQRFVDLETGFLELAENRDEVKDAELAERMDLLEEGMAEAATLLKYISLIQNEQDALRRRVNVMNDQIADIASGMQETSRILKRA